MNFYLCIALFVYTLVKGQEEVTECGVQSIQDLEVDGETVKAGTQPWHITVSLKRPRRRPRDAEVWKFYCPGTLISPKHVLTSSTVRTFRGLLIVENASELQLAAGQYFTNKYIATVAHAQKRGVSNIIVHNQLTVNDHYNIRLLVADHPFDLSWAVNVACVDWTHLLPPPTPSDVIIMSSVRHGINNTARADVFSTDSVKLLRPSEFYTAVTGNRTDAYVSESVDENSALLDMFFTKTTTKDSCFHLQGAGVLVAHPTASGARFYLIGVIDSYLSYTPVGNCNGNSTHVVTNVIESIDWMHMHMHPTSVDYQGEQVMFNLHSWNHTL